MMWRPIGSRWVLLALPILVGGLLAMHGLAGGLGAVGAAAIHEASEVAPDGTSDAHHEGDCAHCQLGHMMLACVAVLAAAATFAKAPTVQEHTAAVARRPVPPRWARLWTQRTHPPEAPAWVRLEVMLA